MYNINKNTFVHQQQEHLLSLNTFLYNNINTFLYNNKKHLEHELAQLNITVNLKVGSPPGPQGRRPAGRGRDPPGDRGAEGRPAAGGTPPPPTPREPAAGRPPPPPGNRGRKNSTQ